MTTHRLPQRIALLMAGSTLLCLLAMGLAVVWLARGMDEQSRSHSTTLVRNAFEGLLDRNLSMTLDYAKWDDAVSATQANDLEWLFENMGSSAVLGEAFQIAVLWGGFLEQDLGWRDDGHEAARRDLLRAGTLARVDQRLAEMPVGTYEGATFFLWHGSELLAAAASRIESPDPEIAAAHPASSLSHLLVGQRVGGDMRRVIEKGTLVNGIVIGRVPPKGDLWLPLPGIDRKPVAFVSWRTPLKGTELLERMLPLLVGVAALVGALALLAAALARRSARHLVEAESRSSLAARSDPLTGLPNRAAFNEALARPARAGERAILYLDLNGFKGVNDSIGHAAGDRVIAEVGARLGPLCDANCRLARIGGDEFVFWLTGPGVEARAEWLAQAAERALAPPLDVMGHRLRVGGSIGWAVQDDEATSGELLVHRADLAMAEAKRRRGVEGAGPVAWDALIEDADRDARAIEGALREALAAPGQIWVAYQPIAPVAASDGTRRLARAEALARWSSPALGSVPPDRFVAVAERSGLVVELGRRVLELVCDDLAAHPTLSASINVSPRQLVAPTFVPELIEAVSRRGIKPSRLEIELTEQVVVDDPRLAARCLRDLHEAGFTTALDDFGTGYSSIGYLRQMEFDALKIDRSFVSGFPGNPSRLALLDAMIQAAHALGLSVVCEGIETAEEMDLLYDLGCDLAQGWHIDRPMAIDALAARWLAPEATPARAGAA